MRDYKIGIFGSVGVRSVEIDEKFPSDQYATNYVQRCLKNYFPVYYSAALWRKGDDGEFTHFAEFTSQVTVTVKMTEQKSD